MTEEKLNEETVNKSTEQMDVTEKSKDMEKNEVALKSFAQEMLENVTTEERQEILKATKEIDLEDDISIKAFGKSIQQQMKKTSTDILDNEKVADNELIGKDLNDLMFNLQTTGRKTPRKGWRGWIDKAKQKGEDTKFEITSEHITVKDRVNEIAISLQNHNAKLLSEIKNIDKLLEDNAELEKKTAIYIKAGDLKLKELDLIIIPQIREELAQNESIELTNMLHDKLEYYDRLDKRIMDLRLTQQVLKQSRPQLTITKSTSFKLSDRIDSAIDNAIPLWVNQIVQLNNLQTQKQVLGISNMVINQTNKMLETSSIQTKENAIEIAQQNERGIIDIETLEKAQQALLDTVKETLEIQAEGKIKRAESRERLIAMEQQMKDEVIKMSKDLGREPFGEENNGRKTVYDTTKTEELDYNPKSDSKDSGFEKYL